MQIRVGLPEMHNTSRELHTAFVDVVKVRFVEIIYMEYLFNDVLEIKNGKNQKLVENPEGLYPIYGSGGIIGYADKYICEANTVIIGRKGSINNPIYVSEPFWNVDTAFGLSPKQDLLLPRYLFYFCKNYNFEKLNKTVTIPSLTKADLLKIQIDLPSIDEQKKIVDELIKVETIINLRNYQVQQLDDLIKARFIELFGTIHDNRFGFSVVTLQDVSAPIKDGTHQTPTYTTDVENGYKFLSSKDVTTGKVDWSHLKYIPEELHRELYARISPRKGDLLLAKNGTTGIAAIVDRDEVFDIYVSLALIRPQGVDTTYLWAAINAAETKQQFDASLKGIGVPNLHLGEIKKARIILPPMELQEQFAAFVEQTDKSKATVQKALDETQLLFDSLMQQYFG